MAKLDHWINADSLNVFQIALLLEGIDPAPLERLGYHGLPDEMQDRTTAHVVNIKNSVKTGKLWPLLEIYEDSGEYNWNMTLFDVTSIKSWLWLRGIRGTVFGNYEPTNKTPSHPFSKFYAPKLAAAQAAWEAVTADPKRLRGKSPKQALEGWLRENAATYGLLNKNGKPNETGIAEIAKVANWRPNGGAPATPQASGDPSPSFGKTLPRVAANPPYSSTPPDPNDDLPF